MFESAPVGLAGFGFSTAETPAFEYVEKPSGVSLKWKQAMNKECLGLGFRLAS